MTLENTTSATDRRLTEIHALLNVDDSLCDPAELKRGIDDALSIASDLDSRLSRAIKDAIALQLEVDDLKARL